ncbi:hypothetical protein [Enterovibrio norvegicus]|uniref:Uncharacterized protein n=1 Tax=Enterovibrio norvegicus TaxID=188144 RepID=A0ABV4L4N0_9GAMM|nr:hypothetical protein [Enterovibrio norvegicus]OEF55538.1 hypothetical protein A1OU_24590 [Enterovibrio norvegicus]
MILQEGNYKGSVDTTLILCVIYCILTGGLLSRQFSGEQIVEQIFITLIMFSYTLVGYVYFRFFTENESIKFSVWRAIAYMIMTIFSVAYMFQAVFVSAKDEPVFYVLLLSIITLVVIEVIIACFFSGVRVSNHRYDTPHILDFSVSQKIGLIGNGDAGSVLVKRFSQFVFVLSFVVLLPFMHGVVGAYVIGVILTYMTYVAVKVFLLSISDCYHMCITKT